MYKLKFQMIKNNYYYYVPPVITISVAPFLMQKYSTLLTFLLMGVVYYLGRIKKGYTVEILAIVLSCIPFIGARGEENEGVNIFQFNYIKALFPYVFLLIYATLWNKMKLNSEFKKWIYISIPFLGITLLYAFIYNTFSLRILNEITYVCMTMCFFFIAYEDRMPLRNQIHVVDILFYFVCIYSTVQFLLDKSPYNWAFEKLTYSIDFIRASGLFGNSLMLSCYVIMYQCFLLIRSSITNRIPWVKLLLCIIIGLMTISRTTVLLCIIQVVLWLYYTNRIKSAKVIVLTFTFFILIWCFLQYLLPDAVETVIGRFENEEAGHRGAAYGTVYNLFKNHPFGVGSDFLPIINREHLYTKGFITDFPTFDNYFLTQLAKYGVLSIVVFIFDYYLLFKIIKLKAQMRQIAPLCYLLFTIRTLLGFSFDIEGYYVFNICFYSYIAYLIKFSEYLKAEKFNFCIR